MMKKWPIFLLAAGFVWMQSCKEIGPNIDFSEGAAAGEDTAYMADVETPQAKNVLAEEFTGVSCPPCPDGHDRMAAIKKNNNDNVIIIGYHIFNYPQGYPVTKGPDTLTHEDFRTQDATEVGNSVFGGATMPQAGFDRREFAGQKLNAYITWSGAADDAFAKAEPKVNIHLTTSYNDSNREATVIVKLAYTDDVTIKQNLTLAILEDSLIDAQKRIPDLIIKDYVHDHVLRDIITPTYGTPIPEKADPKVAGKVYERTFKFILDDKWTPKHCHIVAFVNNDDVSDRTVMQAEEAKLIP